MGWFNTTSPETPKKKKVLIIGAGAAGTAAAWCLSRHPDRFEVEVWESLSQPGGVASSLAIKDGAAIINDQVQGGAPSYRHNLALLAEAGFKPTPVAMKVSFGTGSARWTNTTDSELVKRLRPEIKRFGELLKWVSKMEILAVVIPIDRLLRIFCFSEEFRNQMVFPLVALFFGTGNQTPTVSSAIVARVFLDPNLRLFDYCPDRLLNAVPEMFAFPVLQDVFKTLAAQSKYTLCCDRPAARIVRTEAGVVATDTKGVSAEFDEVVFCCDAEMVLKLLDKPRWLEKRLLSNVKYYVDYCLTHEDKGYMDKMYDLNSQPGEDNNYFVRTYKDVGEPGKIEMSFNLTTYQPHLKQSEGVGDIYQTYYLDAKYKHLWSDGEVDKDKVIASRWMKQFAHSWTHFAYWVPWVRFIQGRQHTWFAGAYTLVNTQEVAVMSGLAVAERLGADYPFPDDPLAALQFDTFLGVVHGKDRRIVKKEGKEEVMDTKPVAVTTAPTK